MKKKRYGKNGEDLDHKSSGRHGCDRRGIRTGDERPDGDTGSLSLRPKAAKAARAM